MKQLAALIVAAVLLVSGRGANGQGECENNELQEGECVELHEGTCGEFYTHTFFPNSVTTNDVEAGESFTSFKLFYEDSDRCTPLAKIYTCLAVFPVCDSGVGAPEGLRPPCRSLCEQVQEACDDWITARGGYSLLDSECILRDCERYPTTGCVGPRDPLIMTVLNPEPPPDNSTGNDTGCPPPDLNFFKSEEQSFAKGWIAFWSVMCFISTLVTILTFCLKPSRFEYPWRPVIYLALSFNIHSLGYFLALILGRDLVTCPDDEFVETDVSWHWGHTPCILVFSLLYYSIMAAFLWWLVLTFSWFLASAFKWSNEAISHLYPFFHIVAWVVPLLLTISLIAARVISADELTATCFVVRDDHTASFVGLLVGVIVPLCTILITGIVFLVIGFVSAFRIHSFMKHEQRQRDSRVLEKLMIRVGIFVTVYIIPAAVIIACFIYELDTRPDWDPLDSDCSDCTRPNTAVFMVRIFMFLLIGVLTGVWIWSKKTVRSWQGLPEKVNKCLQGNQCCELSLELQQTDSDVPPPVPSYPMERKSTQYATESADSSA